MRWIVYWRLSWQYMIKKLNQVQFALKIIARKVNVYFISLSPFLDTYFGPTYALESFQEKFHVNMYIY